MSVTEQEQESELRVFFRTFQYASSATVSIEQFYTHDPLSVHVANFEDEVPPPKKAQTMQVEYKCDYNK